MTDEISESWNRLARRALAVLNEIITEKKCLKTALLNHNRILCCNMDWIGKWGRFCIFFFTSTEWCFLHILKKRIITKKEICFNLSYKREVSVLYGTTSWRGWGWGVGGRLFIEKQWYEYFNIKIVQYLSVF